MSALTFAALGGAPVGGAEGAGLGVHFLKHVQRTRVLLHLVTLDAAPGRSPALDYHAVRHELETFEPGLSELPEIVAM